MAEQKRDRKTNVADFIGALGAGITETQLEQILSECAQAVILCPNNKKKAKLTLTLDIQKFGNNEQVLVTSKLAYTTPTEKGDKSENTTEDTTYFVGFGGKMTDYKPEEDDNGQKNFNLTQEQDGASSRMVEERPSNVRAIG